LAHFTLLLAIAGFPNSGHAADPEPPGLRVGFASSMFTDVNGNDATAAVKAWGQMAAKDHGVATDPEPQIFKDQTALLLAFRNRSVDVAAMTTPEFRAVSKEVRLAPIFVTYEEGKDTVQYVLLVRRDSKIESLADLRGRSFAFHRNSRLSLSQPWLDTLLAEKGLPPAAAFAGRITQSSRLANVVLPVFFRTTDACVVTRNGFDLMSELNPQVGKELKVIATSVELVPCVFAFRADYSPPFKEQLLDGLRNLHKTPAGLQMLTIFHGEKLEEQPVSCLDSATELLDQHALIANYAGTTNLLPRAAAAQTLGGVNP
jgi:phosphonate transport system substrate-binding protein